MVSLCCREGLWTLRKGNSSVPGKMAVIQFKTSLPASLVLYPANSVLASLLNAVVIEVVLISLQAPLGVFQSLRIQFMSPSNNFRKSRQIQKWRGGFLSQAFPNKCPILQPGTTFINGFSEFMTLFQGKCWMPTRFVMAHLWTEGTCCREGSSPRPLQWVNLSFYVDKKRY